MRRSNGQYFQQYLQSGATVLELAIAIPLLLMLLLGIVDLSRFLAVQALLNKGALSAMNLATKVSNLDIDIRNLTSTDTDYLSFVEARSRVFQEAVRIPLSALVTDFAVQSPAQLLAYTTTDSVLPTAVASVGPSVTFGAALLRPGDEVLFHFGGSVSTVSHPTLPATTPPPAQDIAALLKAHPIMIELRAQVRMYSPFLRDLTAVGRAMGFREEVPRGPFGASGPVVGGGGIPTTTSSTSTSTTTTSTTTTTLDCDINWPRCITQTLAPSTDSIFGPQDINDMFGFCRCLAPSAVGAL